MVAVARKKISRTSPTKKKRRDRRQIQHICDALYQVLNEEHPMTVRQVFYRMVSSGVIAKTEAEYKSTICRLLAKLRRQEIIPYRWIADNTRWMRKPRSYSSLFAALQDTAN